MIQPKGGYAFPQNDAAVNRINNEAGMTLRDWFAGQALLGNLANPQSDGDPVVNAEWAYKYADAMLAEREKGGGA